MVEHVIGVVMPTYNQVKFIRAALDSYNHQTIKSSLVIVNDGCTDGTEDVLKEYSFNVVTHPGNLDIANAINTGVNALGDVEAISWISSDNEMDPQWLEILSNEIFKNNAGAAYGGFTHIYKEDEVYIFIDHERDRLVLKHSGCYYGPAFLIRADVWMKAGKHRGRLSHDYDHWLRVEEVCYSMGLPIIGVNKSLCRYNAHDDRVTITRAHENDCNKWQAEAIERRKSLYIYQKLRSIQVGREYRWCHMRFAIITPTIGRETLKRCLITMRHQVYKNYVHIVVGDGPQEQWVKDECEENKCYYVNTHIKEGGYGAAPRNLAMSMIEKGEFGNIDYVVFVDDDNVLLESALYNIAKVAIENNSPPLIWHDILFTNKYKTMYYTMPICKNVMQEGDWDFLNCFFRLDIIYGMRAKPVYNQDFKFAAEADIRANHKWVKCDGVGGVHFLSWDTFELNKIGDINVNI